MSAMRIEPDRGFRACEAAVTELGEDFEEYRHTTGVQLVASLRQGFDTPADVVARFVEGDPNDLLLCTLALARLLPHDGRRTQAGEVTVVQGDLVTDEDIECCGAHLCVLGDLTTSGRLRVGEMDPLGSLAVGGTILASSIMSDGVLLAGRDIRARFIELHHNDGIMRATGTLEAEVLVSRGEHAALRSESRIRHALEADELEADECDGYPLLSSILVEACLSAGEPDWPAIHAHCREGRPFLKPV